MKLLTCRETLDLRALVHVESLQAPQLPEAFGEQKLENKMILNDMTHSQEGFGSAYRTPF